MEGLEQTTEQVHKLAGHMTEAHKSAMGLADIFGKVLVIGTGFQLLQKAMHSIVERSQIYNNVQRALSAEYLDSTKTFKLKHAAMAKAEAMETGLNRLFHNEEYARLKTGELHLDKQRTLIKSYDAQIKLTTELGKISKWTYGIIGIGVGAMLDIALKSRELNQNLIEANASWETRSRLMYSTLQVQGELGAGFDQTTAAAQALVHFGMDTEKTFVTNLKVVTQMNLGLGISAQSAANLATVVERQVKGSFKGVADVIAQLVDDTALAGEEATKMATAISTAMGRLKPGMGAAGLPEVVKLVGRYEGALKEVGGMPGAFQEMLTKMTTVEGLTGAGTLGISPDFLATAEGVSNALQKWGQFAKGIVGATTGWERQMRLDALAHQFGMSADQVNQMMLAYDRANSSLVSNISLQDRWREQMHAVDQGWTRLVNSLISMLQRGLYPIISGINWLISTLADFVGWVAKSRAAAWTFSAVAGAVFLGAIWSLRGVVGALRSVIVTANLAAQAAVRLAAAQAAQAATGGAGGPVVATATQAGMWGRLGSLLTGILRSVWMWALRPVLFGLTTVAFVVGSIAALVGGIIAIRLWEKKRNQQLDAQDAANQKIYLDKKAILDEKYRAQIGAYAVSGQAVKAQSAITGLYGGVGSMFVDVKDATERLKQSSQWVGEQQTVVGGILAESMYRRSMFQDLLGKPDEVAQQNDELVDLTRSQDRTSKQVLDALNKRLRALEREAEEKRVQEALRRAERMEKSSRTDELRHHPELYLH